MTQTTTFNVVEANIATIKLDDIADINVKEDYTIKGTLTSYDTAIADAEVKVTVNNEEYTTTTDSKGAFTVESTANTEGTYTSQQPMQVTKHTPKQQQQQHSMQYAKPQH